jgi:hypothetical protein
LEKTKKWVLNPFPVALLKRRMGLIFWVIVVEDGLRSIDITGHPKNDS